MAELPEIVRQRLRAQQEAETRHPSADLLTAFVEQALSERERQEMLEHLVGCADCREVVSLALPQETAAELVAAAGSPKRAGVASFGVEAAAVSRAREARAASKPWRWPLPTWGGALAAAVIVSAAVVTLRYSRPPAPPPAATAPQPSIVAQDRRAEPTVVIPPQVPAAPSLRPPQPPAKIERGAQAAGPAAKGREQLLGKSDAARAERPGERNDEQAASGQLASATPQRPPRAVEEPAVAAQRPAAEARPAAPPAAATSGVTRQAQVYRDAPLSAAPSSSANEAATLRKARPGVAGQVAPVRMATRWSISAAGQVQRSDDGGRTWQAVPIVDVQFRALSALGAEIWAGGSGGALFHSADSGESWTRVAVMGLSGDITSVVFADAQRGEVVTSSRQRWLTSDGGQTWVRR